jgi:hypothetical protein
MEKLITIVLFFLMFNMTFAQAPQKMSYQSIIRDSAGILVTNTTVGMKISILQGSSTGNAVFVETHTPATNINGLATFEIGNGNPVSGSFSGINWSSGPYYIKSQTDLTGGTNYTITGTSELLSVPYALYAESVNPTTISTLSSGGRGKSAVVYTTTYAHAFYQDASGTGTITSTSLNGTPLGAVSDTSAILVYTSSSAHVFYQNSSSAGTWTSTSLSGGAPIGTASTDNILLVYTAGYAQVFYQDGSGNGTWSSTSLSGTPINAVATNRSVVIYTNSYMHSFYLNNSTTGTWTSTSLSGNPIGIITTK